MGICQILYLNRINPQVSLGDSMELISFNHSGTLSVDSATKFVSPARLGLNFQNEGRYFCLTMLLKCKVMAE